MATSCGGRAFAPAVHGFLDMIREGHPSTPLLVLSPILCPIHEDTPGPGTPDFTEGSMRFRATGADRAHSPGLALIVLSIAGYRTWWLRRPSGGLGVPPKVGTLWRTVPSPLLLVFGTLMILLPLLGV